MLRWTRTALAATLLLLLVAGVTAGVTREGALRQWASQGRLGLMLRAVGLPVAGLITGQTAAMPLPFAAETAPAWSTTDRYVTQFQERVRSRPDDAVAFAQLASLYLQKARETGDPTYYARAEAAANRSIELEPNNVLAALAMGGLQLARHEFSGAAVWGERVRQVVPAGPVAYGILTDANVEVGNYDGAVATLQKMVDLRPDLNSLSRVSYLRELYGDLPGAIDAMMRAVNAGGPASESANWSRVQLGHLYFQTGDLDAAETQYRAALRLLPDYVHATAGLARLAAARGQMSEAVRLYRQVVETLPAPEYAIALGDVYRAAGNPAAARQQDDLVRAIAHLQRAAGMDVDLEMALFEVDHAADSRASSSALELARTAHARRPESIHAADVLAWALYRAGQTDEALPVSRQALRLGTRDPAMRYRAGTISAAAGLRDEAAQHLETALAANSAFHVRYAPEAKQLLAQLRKR